MSKIWLKRFIEKLNRSDGVAIMAIVALMLMMTILGGVFASIMGGWQVSAPYAINSNRASQLANSAATFALQEAKNNIAGTVVCGNRTSKVSVLSNDGNGGSAYYWIECPGNSGTPYANDDQTGGIDDDIVDDDLDDNSTQPNYIASDDLDLNGVSDLYTVIATGKVVSGATTVARRQIKVFVLFPPGTSLDSTGGGIAY